jgi:hypothetical protein
MKILLLERISATRGRGFGLLDWLKTHVVIMKFMSTFHVSPDKDSSGNAENDSQSPVFGKRCDFCS